MCAVSRCGRSVMIDALIERLVMTGLTAVVDRARARAVAAPRSSADVAAIVLGRGRLGAAVTWAARAERAEVASMCAEVQRAVVGQSMTDREVRRVLARRDRVAGIR